MGNCIREEMGEENKRIIILLDIRKWQVCAPYDLQLLNADNWYSLTNDERPEFHSEDLAFNPITQQLEGYAYMQ